MKYVPYLYLLFTALLYLAGAPLQLWDQDEAAYAGMARQMLETGNWVVPEFMWSDVHRKPPLHIWNIAVMYKLFGINEFSVRLSSLIFILLTYWLVYQFTIRIADKRTAAIAMVIASTSLLVPMLARIAVTDATLLFFFTLCAYTLYRQLDAPSWKWVLLFWTSFALALLTKGPPILLFAIIFALLLVIFLPERKKLYSLHPWFFLPLACAPLFFWAYTTTKYDQGALLSWMLDFYILKRVNSSMFGQTGPPGTHLFIILLSFLPYILYIPRTVRRSYHEFREKKPEVIFLASWFIASWFIYEFSPSKLPSYTVAAHIPLAILIARYAASIEKQNRYAMLLHYLMTTIWIAGLVIIPFLLNLPERVQTVFALVGFFIGVYNLFPLFSKELRKEGVRFYCRIGIIVQIAVSIFILPSLELLKLNTKKVAEHVHINAPETTSVLIGNDTGLPPGLPFYLKNTVATVTTVKAEYYLSEWVAAYYDHNPTVLILKKNQLDAFREIVPNVHDTGIPSFRLETLDSFSYHIVENLALQKQANVGSLTVAPPVMPVSYEVHLKNISGSKEWTEMIARKAIEKKMSTDEMIKADARFLYERDSAIYQYEHRIRKSNEWLNDLQKKAKASNISLEEMTHREATYILEKRNIQ